MTITPTNLGSAHVIADGPYTLSPSASGTDRLQLLALAGGASNGVQPGVPSVSGRGLTWTLEGTVDYDAAGGTDRATICLFSAIGTPTGGDLTVTYAGLTLVMLEWILDEFDGVDTAAPIVQANTAVGTNLTSLSVALAAFADAVNNAAYGCSAHQAGEATTEGAGFTPLANPFGGGGTGANSSLISEYLIGEDTSVDSSWSTARRCGAVAVEIAAASGGPLIINADPAILDLSGVDVTVAGDGAATIAADPAVLALSGVDAAASGVGAATIAADPAALILAGVDPTVAGAGQALIAADPAILQLVGVEPSVTAGAIIINADPAILQLVGGDVTVAGAGQATIPADPAILELAGVDAAAAGSGAAQITADAAVLDLSGVDVAASGSGAAQITADAAVLVLSGVDPDIFASPPDNHPMTFTARAGRTKGTVRDGRATATVRPTNTSATGRPPSNP